MKQFKNSFGLILTILSTIFLVTSCSNEIDTSLPIPAPETKLSTKVSINQALERAETFLNEVNGNTRATRRIVSSIDIIGSKKTRGTETTDTLLYLINFSNNQGFALMGSDERMSDIYAISDKGNLNQDCIDENPMLEQFINDARAHAQNSFGPIIIDSIKTSYTYMVKENSGKLIHENVAEWSQNDPFNKYCFTPAGQKSTPGCFTVAASMIMSYFRWPLSYANYYYKWQDMIDNNNKEEVAFFLNHIGKAFNAVYEPGAGYVPEFYISSGYKKLGYSINSDYMNIEFKTNTQKVYNLIFGKSLGNTPRQPVIITGYVKGDKRLPGHAFVIDGIVERIRIQNINGRPSGASQIAPTLYHILWGWNTNAANYNGYYLYFGSSDLFSDYAVGFDNKQDYESDMPSGGNAFSKLEIISGVSPNK